MLASGDFSDDFSDDFLDDSGRTLEEEWRFATLLAIAFASDIFLPKYI